MSIFCPNCNTSNVNEAKFCKNCGGDIAEELKKRYEEEAKQQNIKQEEEKKTQEESKIDSYEEKPKTDDMAKSNNFGLFIAIIIFVIVLAMLGMLMFGSNSNATQHLLPKQESKGYEVSDKVYVDGEVEFKDGIFYEDGTNVKANGIVKLYYPSGKLESEVNSIDGKFNGIAKKYYESGALKKEDYFKDNKKNGISKEYYESGSLKKELNYKDGKLNDRKDYYESGVLDYEADYKDDKQNGISKAYYESGALMYEDNYKDDKLNGISKGYSESGALEYKVTTKDDKAISGILYKENGKIDRQMTNADFTKYSIKY